eukprot:1155229-Pelagomonas_calceolata.AAC.8
MSSILPQCWPLQVCVLNSCVSSELHGGKASSVYVVFLIFSCMGAGSFLKGKPGGVMDRIAFRFDTGEVCACRGVIALNSLMFGNGICAFAACNSSVRFDRRDKKRGT